MPAILQHLLNDERFADSIFVVMATKQDLDDVAAAAAVPPSQLLETLDLHHAIARTVLFTSSSAKTGSGIIELVSLLGAALPFDPAA